MGVFLINKPVFHRTRSCYCGVWYRCSDSLCQPVPGFDVWSLVFGPWCLVLQNSTSRLCDVGLRLEINPPLFELLTSCGETSARLQLLAARVVQVLSQLLPACSQALLLKEHARLLGTHARLLGKRQLLPACSQARLLETRLNAREKRALGFRAGFGVLGLGFGV